MKFRLARHTTDLKRIHSFYCGVLGMEQLGSFRDHDGYDGLFLGYLDTDWHLEFTTNHEAPIHTPDPDDLMVLYLNSSYEQEAILRDAKKAKVEIVKSRNPYWTANGIQIQDPDGYGIILAVKSRTLLNQHPRNLSLQERNIHTWDDAITYVQSLPYGRNTERGNLDIVLQENKGTCSSKHAFLKDLADINDISGVRLILGIYKMNAANTPGIGKHISEHNLEYIPEAHCYLKINGKRIDITSCNSTIERIKDDILEEIEIQVDQITSYKITYHQDYLRTWCTREKHMLSYEQIWDIRERCISSLAENN